MSRTPSPTLERILFIPDVHRPFHDRAAWKLMLRAAKDFKPDILIILGDFADCLAYRKVRISSNQAF